MEFKKILTSALKNHKENNLEEAIKLYKKVLNLRPNHLDAIYNLAIIFSRRKNYAEASNFFLKYTKIDPKNPGAYNNLGLTFFYLGKIDEAIKFIKKSIDLNPKFSDAYNNLGFVYIQNGKIDEGEKYCLKAYDLNPKSHATYSNLKLIFRKQDKFKNLEKLYVNTIRLNPKFLEAYVALMDIYERSHQEKKLDEIIKKAEKEFLNNDVVNLYKGKIHFNNQKFKEAIYLIEPISFKLDTLEQSKSLVLAKSYDKINNIEKAYENFSKMNNISFKNKSNKIDKNRYLNLVKERTNFFVNEKFEKWDLYQDKKAFNNPVFLIGFPRSGTTLLDTIIRSHPKIDVIEEKPILEEIIKKSKLLTNNSFLNLKKLNSKDIDELRKIYFNKRLEYIKKEDSGKIYIDKLPLNIIYVGEIIRIFPNAKFLFSLRNPYDCILSCFMQDFLLNDAMSNFINLNDTAILYNSVMKLWHQYLNLFQIKRHTIKYEDLVLNFDDTVKKVLDFLNIDWSDSIYSYRETAKERDMISTPSYNQVIKPIYKQAINRWKRYEDKMQNIKPIIEPWIKKFNYK